MKNNDLNGHFRFRLKKHLEKLVLPLIAGSCLFSGLVGCRQHGPTAGDETPDKVIEVTDNGDEVRMPRQIWALLETEGNEIESASVGTLPVEVRLREKTPGTLFNHSIRLKFPQGGGTIDLADFVAASSGTIKLGIEVAAEPESEIRSFFVSHAKKRRIEGEIWGGGCRSFFEITNLFHSQISPGEFELNLTRARHVSVVGGTFFITARKKKDLWVTQISFRDRQSPHLFCDPVPGKAPPSE